jgi:hypothetical protein
MESSKEKWNRRLLFSALRAGEALTVHRLERKGEVTYSLAYGNRQEALINRETLLKRLDLLGWQDWQVEAKGLMDDFPLGMAVLDRIRGEGREPWRSWIRSAGWLQATVAGAGAWGEKVVSLLDSQKIERCASIGSIGSQGLLSDSDQVRVLIIDSMEEMTPDLEKWIRGQGNSLSFIFMPKLPIRRDLPGVWIEVAPGSLQGLLEDFLFELLEGCFPFGILSNGFKDLLPHFQRPHEGIIKMVTTDHEEWLEEVTDEMLATVGWDSRWGKVQVLFFLIQSSPYLVDQSHLYPLSLAIRQGVPPTCRVMASVRENLSLKSDWVRVLLLGLKPESKGKADA